MTPDSDQWEEGDGKGEWMEWSGASVPFGVGILPHTVTHGVNLLPRFTPLVSVPLFGGHVDNLELVAPLLHILAFVLNAIPLDRPFTRAFPFHDASTLIGSEDDDIFAAAAEKAGTVVQTVKGWR